MSQPFIGEIRLMPYGRTNLRYWALCNGQICDIYENPVLYSIISNYYGGDGIKTFSLPNLNHPYYMTPVTVKGTGKGPGLSPSVIADYSGVSEVQLRVSEIPAHNHLLNVSKKGSPEFDTPQNDSLPHLLYSNSGLPSYKTNPDPKKDVGMGEDAIAVTGSGQPHENQQPFLALCYFIALEGIYPQRPGS